MHKSPSGHLDSGRKSSFALGAVQWPSIYHALHICHLGTSLTLHAMFYSFWGPRNKIGALEFSLSVKLPLKVVFTVWSAVRRTIRGMLKCKISRLALSSHEIEADENGKQVQQTMIQNKIQSLLSSHSLY